MRSHDFLDRRQRARTDGNLRRRGLSGFHYVTARRRRYLVDFGTCYRRRSIHLAARAGRQQQGVVTPSRASLDEGCRAPISMAGSGRRSKPSGHVSPAFSILGFHLLQGRAAFYCANSASGRLRMCDLRLALRRYESFVAVGKPRVVGIVVDARSDRLARASREFPLLQSFQWLATQCKSRV